MATNSSEHLGLHLWEPNDQVLRTEFNQNWSKLDEAVNTAQETAETQCQAGTYTGDGKTAEEGGQLIETGFPPKFVIITRGWLYQNNMPSSFMAAGQSMLEGTENFITLQSNGFTVAAQDSGHIQLNTAGTTYSYVAFR